MAQVIADRRDVDFVLYEQFEIEKISKSAIFADFTRKTIDLILSEARNLANKEMLPTLKLGDEEGCTFDNGHVRVPESYHRLYSIFVEGGWISMCDSPEWGGQGMPSTVAMAARSFFNAANFAFTMNTTLTHGAGKIIENYGTDKQKKLFLRKLYSGEWSGTMLLTEAQAGSDVGALTTTAVENEDGTYAISGNKLFISYGENDLVKNIVHPVLARIEGAPAGAAGISLFIVPKIWVNDDGSLGEFNDVVCTGIEEKMGLHGSPTCSLTLGSKGRCRGTLLGNVNKGMRVMFIMMNEARLDVGMQAFGCASASFLNALNYARERVQGKHLHAIDKNAPPVPIIQHPDVRRMLLTMKVYTEGIRSIMFYAGLCEDKIRISDNPVEKDRYQSLIEVLIPIAKGYASDRAFDVCNMGVQVYGGYGYIREYPQEQLFRDCKITHIYEGTNGIQAMSLLGRNLGLGQGQGFRNLLDEITKTTDSAKCFSELEGISTSLYIAVSRLEEVALHMEKTAKSDKIMNAYVVAYPFMEITGDTVMAWMLLWRATVAAIKLGNGAKKKDMAFYQGQIKSAQFFIGAFIPVTLGKMNAILKDDGIAVDISEDAFGGK